MSRRLSAFAVLAGLVATQTGCHSRCDQRPALMSGARSNAPCQTVGRNSGCFDAVTGQPVPCPPDVPTNVVPGGFPYPPIGPMPGVGPRPTELPMPAPTENIPSPAVPFPAPPPPNDASLPYPTGPGVPVKVVPNK